MKSLIFFLLCSISVFAEDRKALIFDIGKTKESPRFIQETQIEETLNDKKWTSKITDPKGTLVMTEKANITGGKLIYQYIEQLQINEAYELTIQDAKATFQTFHIVDGKKASLKESKTVSLDEDLITGPLTEAFLQQNWQALLDGKKILVDFGVFELQKTVGFEFKRIKETETTLEIQMKPSNFLISMLVDNIQIDFNKERKRMVYFKGRTPLRLQKKGGWEPMDAEIIYPE